MIHIVKASRMSKAELILLIYGKSEWMHINANIPQEDWDFYHPPSHVLDTRTNKIVCLMDEGIKRKKIFKTL